MSVGSFAFESMASWFFSSCGNVALFILRVPFSLLHSIASILAVGLVVGSVVGLIVKGFEIPSPSFGSSFARGFRFEWPREPPDRGRCFALPIRALLLLIVGIGSFISGSTLDFRFADSSHSVVSTLHFQAFAKGSIASEGDTDCRVERKLFAQEKPFGLTRPASDLAQLIVASHDDHIDTSCLSIAASIIPVPCESILREGGSTPQPREGALYEGGEMPRGGGDTPILREGTLRTDSSCSVDPRPQEGGLASIDSGSDGSANFHRLFVVAQWYQEHSIVSAVTQGRTDFKLRFDSATPLPHEGGVHSDDSPDSTVPLPFEGGFTRAEGSASGGLLRRIGEAFAFTAHPLADQSIDVDTTAFRIGAVSRNENAHSPSELLRLLNPGASFGRFCTALHRRDLDTAQLIVAYAHSGFAANEGDVLRRWHSRRAAVDTCFEVPRGSSLREGERICFEVSIASALREGDVVSSDGSDRIFRTQVGDGSAQSHSTEVPTFLPQECTALREGEATLRLVFVIVAFDNGSKLASPEWARALRFRVIKRHKTASDDIEVPTFISRECTALREGEIALGADDVVAYTGIELGLPQGDGALVESRAEPDRRLIVVSTRSWLIVVSNRHSLEHIDGAESSHADDVSSAPCASIENGIALSNHTPGSEGDPSVRGDVDVGHFALPEGIEHVGEAPAIATRQEYFLSADPTPLTPNKTTPFAVELSKPRSFAMNCQTLVCEGEETMDRLDGGGATRNRLIDVFERHGKIDLLARGTSPFVPPLVDNEDDDRNHAIVAAIGSDASLMRSAELAVASTARAAATMAMAEASAGAMALTATAEASAADLAADTMPNRNTFIALMMHVAAVVLFVIFRLRVMSDGGCKFCTRESYAGIHTESEDASAISFAFSLVLLLFGFRSMSCISNSIPKHPIFGTQLCSVKLKRNPKGHYQKHKQRLSASGGLQTWYWRTLNNLHFLAFHLWFTRECENMPSIFQRLSQPYICTLYKPKQRKSAILILNLRLHTLRK